MSTKIFSIKSIGLFIVTIAFLFFVATQYIFAGTLSNENFSSSNNIVDQETTLVFEYTNETLVDQEEENEFVFVGRFGESNGGGGANFDFSALDETHVTVTLDGMSSMVTEAWGDGGDIAHFMFVLMKPLILEQLL